MVSSIFDGFHGTALANYESIKESNFRQSKKRYEWLGYGVYFFIEGISDPLENAKEWAKLHSVRGGVSRYESYTVLKARIVSDEVFDLRVEDNLFEFNRLRRSIEATHKENFKRENQAQHDRLLLNFMHNELGYEVVIGQLFIQNRSQNSQDMQSRIPNTTVLVVRKLDTIESASIKMVAKGECNEH